MCQKWAKNKWIFKKIGRGEGGRLLAFIRHTIEGPKICLMPNENSIKVRWLYKIHKIMILFSHYYYSLKILFAFVLKCRFLSILKLNLIFKCILLSYLPLFESIKVEFYNIFFLHFLVRLVYYLWLFYCITFF